MPLRTLIASLLDTSCQLAVSAVARGDVSIRKVALSAAQRHAVKESWSRWRQGLCGAADQGCGVELLIVLGDVMKKLIAIGRMNRWTHTAAVGHSSWKTLCTATGRHAASMEEQLKVCYILFLLRFSAARTRCIPLDLTLLLRVQAAGGSPIRTERRNCKSTNHPAAAWSAVRLCAKRAPPC